MNDDNLGAFQTVDNWADNGRSGLAHLFTKKSLGYGLRKDMSFQPFKLANHRLLLEVCREGDLEYRSCAIASVGDVAVMGTDNAADD